MKKKVLVTGGAGFIGSHLCGRLLDQDNEVICVDNFYTGSKDNIEHLRNEPKFELIRHDITVPLYVECDEIYNLACPASPVHYQKDPVFTTKTAVHGAINMLGLAKRVHAKILQASTSEVYGDPLMHPQKEDYRGNVDCNSIRSCYDEGKRCAETLFSDYHRQHDVDIRIARIFNTYGPRMAIKDGRLIPNLIMQALFDKPMTVYGDGEQTRSFCYIDDMVDGLIRLMALGDSSPINLGNPDDEINIMNIAYIIRKVCQSDSEVILNPLPEDDPCRRRPDINRARKLLKWFPRIPLKEGLTRTIEWFRIWHGQSQRSSLQSAKL